MIQFRNVTKQFGSVTAVDNISFSLDRGEFFALLGPNGAGKTTLVRMLLGFTSPTMGDITISGVSASKTAARKGIGYLPEQFRVPGHLTGLQFLRRQAALLNLSKADSISQVGQALEMVSMVDARDKKTAGYSKGMKQRIGLAATLLGEPNFLILDEPISGLDPIGVRDVRNTLERLCHRGVTILLNSHLLSEVEKTCKTAGILYKGRLLVKGAINSIMAKDETLEDVFVKYIEGSNA